MISGRDLLFKKKNLQGGKRGAYGERELLGGSIKRGGPKGSLEWK